MRVLRSPPIIGGYQYTTCEASMSVSPPEIGIGIPMLGGGAVYQRTAASVLAPLSLKPDTFNLLLDGITDTEHWQLSSMLSTAQASPVTMFVEWPRTCEWLITGGRTVWTLDRSTAYGTIDYADYAPTAYIRDLGAPTGDVLTVINSGTPSAGEILVSDTTDATTVTTVDLVADAGRVLVLRYHPMRLVTIAAAPRSYEYPDVGKHAVELELVEHVPTRAWT